MATNYTANYQLNQWEPTDQVLHTDFNADNAKLDAALTNLAGEASSKADQTALETLSGQMDQKANILALDQVQSHIPKLVTGTYVGTGGSDEEKPCTLDFTDGLGRPPMLVIIRRESGGYTGLILLQGMTGSNNHFTNSYLSGSGNTVRWSGNKVIWYAGSAEGQMNEYGTTYRYFAIG